jgi:hypothetical protein
VLDLLRSPRYIKGTSDALQRSRFEPIDRSRIIVRRKKLTAATMFLFVQKTGALVVVPNALSHPMPMIRHSIPEECLEVWDVEPKPKTLDVLHLT